MKQKFILLLLLLGVGITSFTQRNYFHHTGNGGDGLWTTADNWDMYDEDGNLLASPAPTYPGHNNIVNPGRNPDDIILIDSTSSANITIPAECGVMRINNMIVNGYEGIITQADDHQLLIMGNGDGAGPWDETLITSDTSSLDLFVGMHAHKMVLNFGDGGAFHGGASTGCRPYNLLIAVPFKLENGTFLAPGGDMIMRLGIEVDSGGFFDNSLEGNTILRARSGSGGTRTYDIDGVTFWDLDLEVKGPAPRRFEFFDGNITVENDLTINGYGSYKFDNTGIFSVKGDVHLTNNANIKPYKISTTFGTAIVEMNGDMDQTIHHINENIYTVPVPNLRVNKSTGDVILDGTVIIQNTLYLDNGIIKPNVESVDQFNLTTDRILLNSNANISGGSDSSYVGGPVQAREFKPNAEIAVGKDGALGMIVLGKHSGTLEYSLTTEFFTETAETGIVSKDTNVQNVAECKVWAISNTSDSSAYFLANLELSYNAESCIAGCKTAVVSWDNDSGEWVSEDAIAVSSTDNGETTLIAEDKVDSIHIPIGTTRLYTLGTVIVDVCDDCDVSAFASYSASEGDFEFDGEAIAGDSTVVLGYMWDFDGEETSYEEDPGYTFETAGVKMITLTITALSGTTLCEDTYVFFVFSNPGVTGIIPQSPGAETPEEAIAQAQAGTAGLDTNTEMFLEIYPNPSNIGFVTLEGDLSGKQFMITTLSGELVLQGNLNNNRETVDVSNISSGLYIVNINNGVTSTTKKLIIQ